MNVKKIKNIVACSILIASFITPAYSVKASDGSKTVSETVTKTYSVTLKDTYKNKKINSFDDLPEELKAKIPKTITYKKNGFEGVLGLVGTILKPVESSKVITYKPTETTKITKSKSGSKKSHPIMGTSNPSFPNNYLVSMTNPYTNKSQKVSATKEGSPKTIEHTISKTRVTSYGRWANYDKDRNAAYGIMSNSISYIRTGTFWSKASAKAFAPTHKVYLGAMTSPLNANWINVSAATWGSSIKPSNLVNAKWSSTDNAPEDADALAKLLGRYDDTLAGSMLYKTMGGNTKSTEGRGYNTGFGWYFRSETGTYNRYRRGMDLTYEVPYSEEKMTQDYSYTFTKPREVDSTAYTTWTVEVIYGGIAHDMRQNNFSVGSVKFNPGTVIIPIDKTRVKQKTSVTFDISYAIYPSLTRQASPKVTVYQGSTALWTGSVPVSAGSTTRRTVSLGSVNYGEGHNVIRVVVNPSKSIKERVPKNANAYTDNSMESSVRGVKSDNCIIYANAPRRTKNDWSEEWSIITQKGTVATDSDGEKYAAIVERKEDKQNKAYTEQYRLTEVYFRSKYTKDNNVNDLPTKGEGWQKLTNGSVATIKAGYGFELIAKTVYTTNRNEGLSITETFGTPYSSTKYGEGFASFKMISPSIGETITPSAMSLTMSNGDGGSKICVLLEQTGKNGDWWNETKTFEIPNKETVQGLMERKVYTAESSKPGVYEISIATPAPSSIASFTGYEAESPVGGGSGMKPKLYDYINFQLEILGQDDIKSHIGN